MKKCPECGETVIKHRWERTGWAVNVPGERLRWAHLTGGPLCPVVTPNGYVPALPVNVS